MLLTGDLQPREGETVHDQIEESGAPGAAARALRRAGSSTTRPWHLDREFSHLFRGTVDADEANELLAAEGHGHLRLVDNGAIAPRRGHRTPST